MVFIYNLAYLFLIAWYAFIQFIFKDSMPNLHKIIFKKKQER